MILKAILNTVATLLLGSILVAGSRAAELSLVIDESTPVIPTDVVYRLTTQGLELSGWIRKRVPHRGRLLGHVEIHLLDDQGRVLTAVHGYPFHFSPTRRNPEKARFDTTIPTVPPGARTIALSYQVH